MNRHAKFVARFLAVNTVLNYTDIRKFDISDPEAVAVSMLTSLVHNGIITYTDIKDDYKLIISFISWVILLSLKSKYYDGKDKIEFKQAVLLTAIDAILL